MGSAVLLRGCIAWGTERSRIPRLPWFEVTGDAEVDKVEVTIGCAHDIGRFEITVDDGRFARVQVVEYRTELHAYVEHLLSWEASIRHSGQVALQCFALDEVEHEVPVPCVGKVVMYAWQVGMLQAR